MAEDVDAAGAGRQHATDHVEQRRLAGAVGANDGAPLALGDVHRDLLYGPDGAEVLAQAVQR